MSARGAQRYLEDGDNQRAQSLRRMNAAYESDPDKFRARGRVNYAANPDVWKDRTRDYRKNNPEKKKVWEHNRRAVGGFSNADVIDKFNSQDWLCVCCGLSLLYGYHIDHIIPVSRGGSNWPDNIQLLCSTCNLKKNALTMEEWLIRIAWIGA